jgi:thiamine biosynthesis protein ThiS
VRVVPRDEFDRRELQDGDRIEIVHFVVVGGH